MKSNEMKPQPLDNVKWVDRALLKPNDYNPNAVAPPEMQLLKMSILETGWTQPIVVDEKFVIIDGFHRYTISGDAEVFALTGGKVPVVTVVGIDEKHRRIATVRHNRARGKHGVVHMSKIVTELMGMGMSEAEIMARMGMEDEEVARLATRDGMPVQAYKSEPNYSKAWKPK